MSVKLKCLDNPQNGRTKFANIEETSLNVLLSVSDNPRGSTTHIAINEDIS